MRRGHHHQTFLLSDSRELNHPPNPAFERTLVQQGGSSCDKTWERATLFDPGPSPFSRWVDQGRKVAMGRAGLSFMRDLDSVLHRYVSRERRGRHKGEVCLFSGEAFPSAM